MFGGPKPSFGENTTALGVEFNKATVESPFKQSSFEKPATSDFYQQNVQQTQTTELFDNNQQFKFGGNIATTQQSLFGGKLSSTLFTISDPFGANKSDVFGGSQVTSLFGTTSTLQALTTGVFRSPLLSNNLFGNYQVPYSSGRTACNATMKYQPSYGSYTLIKRGYLTNIKTRQHCITAMKDFESKSFEELRLTDYLKNRTQTPALFVFGKQAVTGTAVMKYQPPGETYTQVKNGYLKHINTIQHCITVMKDYENKSLEELRFEDYLKNQKAMLFFGSNSITSLHNRKSGSKEQTPNELEKLESSHTTITFTSKVPQLTQQNNKDNNRFSNQTFGEISFLNNNVTEPKVLLKKLTNKNKKKTFGTSNLGNNGTMTTPVINPVYQKRTEWFPTSGSVFNNSDVNKKLDISSHPNFIP